jgi:L-alanine-DL-glutamate epimerase-like enolase superfamily enzyme
MKLSLHQESWRSSIPFRISGHEFNTFDGVITTLTDGGFAGQGEAAGAYYLDDFPDGIEKTLEELRPVIENGIDRNMLQSLLPPGGARNALDCALWDLEAKRSGKRAWEIAGVEPRELQTVFTIGLEATPEEMADKAAAAEDFTLFKVKLDGDRPLERMTAIRNARPDARLVVDANQGWNFEQLASIAGAMADLGVEMIEQPLPRGGDQELEGYDSPIPLCADESCLHLGELEQAGIRYQMINIKLDKCGGLTHGIMMARKARELGLGLMVGCMGGTSLAMAPAYVVGCLCDLVDIDGPLLLTNDRPAGLHYDRGMVRPFGPEVWG